MRSVPPGRQLVPLLLAAVWHMGCGGGGAGGGGLAAPSNLTAAPMGGGIHLTWKDNSTDEDGFDVERKETQGNGAFTALDSVPFDSALYHDAAVNLGSSYTYRVRARRATGYSAYSNEATADLSAGGSGGSSGSGGSGGTASGTGGTAGGGRGSAGSVGTGGQPGSGGQAGRPGTGGQAGRAGTGGQAGRAGTGGQAGRAGTGGTGSPDGGTDASSDSRPPDGPAAAPVSFRRDIAPSLVQSCGSTTSGCHNNDQAVGRIMPQFGPCKVIWFSSVDAPLGATYFSGLNVGKPTGCPDLGLYARLIQLHSMLCDAPTWSERPVYVVPFDLQKSLLYQVIAGDPSMGGRCLANGLPVTKMPKVDPAVLPNGVPLTADKVQKIADWIMQGAPNN
jgi:hypothetical protein